MDLCRGPHIVKTDMVKSVWINKNSSAYWLGNKDLDSLQRVYGVTFPNDKLLKEHKTSWKTACGPRSNQRTVTAFVHQFEQSAAASG